MAKILKTNITDKEKIEEILKNEGFFNIFLWKDKKDRFYPLHTHPYYEVRWIIDGILIIQENHKKFKLHSGDRLETLPNTPHTAYALTDVTYICASR